MTQDTMRKWYSFDDTDKYESLFDMLNSLHEIDQLAEGVIYSVVEISKEKASRFISKDDILELQKMVKTRSRGINNDTICFFYRDNYSDKTLIESIQKIFDEQLECSLAEDKKTIYKSITRKMIDEFIRLKYL